METRTVSYIFHGNNTPPLEDQVKTLTGAGVDVYHMADGALIDKAPSRDARKFMLYCGLQPGDTLLLAAPQVIGSGKVDTAKVVREICVDHGALIQVVGYQAKAYLTDAAIARFAKDAVSESARLNGQNTAARRKKSGPRAKLDDLTDEQWAAVRWWFLRKGVLQSDTVEFCKQVFGTDVSRVNIFQRIKNETQEK